MYKYAQIDVETGVCFSVSYLSSLVEGAHMILLQDDQEVNPGDVYSDGQWTPKEPTTPEMPTDPGPSQDEVIAGLTLEVADLNVRLAENEKITADLVLLVGTGGI